MVLHPTFEDGKIVAQPLSWVLQPLKMKYGGGNWWWENQIVEPNMYYLFLDGLDHHWIGKWFQLDLWSSWDIMVSIMQVNLSVIFITIMIESFGGSPFYRPYFIVYHWDIMGPIIFVLYVIELVLFHQVQKVTENMGS